MPIEKLIKKIKEEAEKKASEILKEAEEESKKILENAEKERVKIITFAKREAQEIKKARVQAIIEEERINEEKKLTAKKQEIVEGVFKRAMVILKNEDADEYKKHAKRLFKLAVQDGDEEVVLDVDERRIGSGFIATLNKENGWSLRLSSEREKMGGGFKLRKGKKVVDFSFPTLFETVGEDLLPEIVKILFQQ